jgi:hypothetical protein
VPIGGSYNGRDFGDTNYYNNIDTLPSLNNGFFDGHAYIMGQTVNLITPKSNQPGGVNMLFPGRLGQAHQEQRQGRYLRSAWNHGRRRGRQFRLLLIRLYENHHGSRTMLDYKKPQAVVIAVRLSLHCPIASAYLDAGCAVFLAKTMCRTIDAAQALA